MVGLDANKAVRDELCGRSRINGYRLLLLAAVVVLGAAWASYWWADAGVARWMDGLTPGQRVFFQYVTELGQAQWWLVPIVVLGLWWVWRRRFDLANRAVLVFLSIAGAGLLNDVLKLLFGRQRPKLLFASGDYGFRFLHAGYDFASFPSGHSAIAGAAAASLCLVAPRRVAWPAGVLALLIVLSRVVITAHYVSDVLAGSLVGVGFAVFMHWRFTRRGWLSPAAGLLRAAPDAGSDASVSSAAG